jgi:DNA-binding transcriptional MerR regulator
MNAKTYTPGEVIKRVGKGLTRDKLAYFVREGYLQPQTERRGEQTYKFYRESDLWILNRAMTYIEKYQTRPRAAFEKARKEYEQVELELK